MNKKKVNSKALLLHAFETMQELKSGDIDIEVAKAQAGLLKQANNILRYELDRGVAFQKFEKLEVRDIED